MTITRRTILRAVALCGVLSLGVPAAFASEEPVVADNGLFTQPFFIETFLEFADDHAEAAAEGKGLVIIFEQRGCPYCREMHRVNFADPKIVGFVTRHFNVVQLDIWGSRNVTDFDGAEMEERALAHKWGVNFTPTLIFFAADTNVPGKAGNMVESARLPGYFKPFHFLSMFEFVESGAFRDQPFQRFLQEKGDRLRAEGKEVDLW